MPCPSCLFISCRINSDDSSAPQHLKQRWMNGEYWGLPRRQRPNSASQCVQLIKYYTMMGGRGRRRSFLCEWLISVSWAEWQSISSCKDFCVSALCLHPVLCVGSFTSCHPPIVGWRKKKPSGFFSFFQTATQFSYCCILSLKRMIIRSVQLWWDYSSSSTVASAGDTCFKAPDFISLCLFFFFFYHPAVFFPVLFYNRKSHERA